jgi:hypothetical protein
MPSVLKPDPFNAVLLNSPPLVVTNEQKDIIRKILDKACSDSRFADKAYAAITYVLLGNNVRAPTVTSLTPNSAEIGDPAFTLHVHGTNFDSTSKIYFNGLEEPTTLVSATEVTTGVNMPLWTAPAVVPVTVVKNGVASDPMNFEFTDGVTGLSLSGNVLGGRAAVIEKKLEPKVDNKLPEPERKEERK